MSQKGTQYFLKSLQAGLVLLTSSYLHGNKSALQGVVPVGSAVTGQVHARSEPVPSFMSSVTYRAGLTQISVEQKGRKEKPVNLPSGKMANQHLRKNSVSDKGMGERKSY